MPPDRGRASRACASCRKQKTRCYEPGTPGKACLRCERLRQNCSLTHTGGPREEVATPTPGTDARLERLEKTVEKLLHRLGEDPSDRSGYESSKSPTAPTPPRPGDATYQDPESSAAPIMVLRDLATDTGASAQSLSGPELFRTPETAIDHIIPAERAFELQQIFLEHYGRWVLFDPDRDFTILTEHTRHSSLLYSACCLIAVRHTSEELAARLAPQIFECVRSYVSETLLVAPQPIEFFQATLILCMWSTTVGQVPLSIDSWLLSGIALQHSHFNPLFRHVTTRSRQPEKMDDKVLNRCFLWNHLCLAHLHYCVGTSRRSMVQGWQIERCRAVLSNDRADNFEIRMVAEIHLYWIAYERLVEESIDLDKSVAALQAWKTKWEFVLDQPRSQFLFMGFHFSNLLLYERAIKSSSVISFDCDPLVSALIHHSTAIVRLAMETVDERTRHLSDHIYHMITFAAIVICRLLHTYQSLLGEQHEVEELEKLIENLIQWLYSIGLPCHAAHTLGKIIAKMYGKVVKPVLPRTHTDSFGEEREESFTSYYFPEFLGLGPSADGNWDLLSGLTLFPPTPNDS